MKKTFSKIAKKIKNSEPDTPGMQLAEYLLFIPAIALVIASSVLEKDLDVPSFIRHHGQNIGDVQMYTYTTNIIRTGANKLKISPKQNTFKNF